MNKLLKDAIADAKAVRETALANAKLALEEAFQPKLQKMFSEKIKHEMEEEAPVEDDDSTMEASMDMENERMNEPQDEMARMKELAGLNEFEDDYDDDDDFDMDIPEDPGASKAAAADASAAGEFSDDEDTGYGDDEEDFDDDEDLEEIIRQLEEDDMKDEMAPDLEEDLDLFEAEDEEEKEKMEEDLDEEINLDEVIEALREGEDFEDDSINEAVPVPAQLDPAALVAALGIPTAAAYIVTKLAGFLQKKAEKDPNGKAAKFLDFMRGMAGYMGEGEDENLPEPPEEKLPVMEELEEAYSVIEHLREKINEVNLLNAKLLYVNKLFKKHSLSESDKVRVVETFDRATTVRETKLIYTTLSESFSTRATKKTKVMTEGFASSPVKKTEILTESNSIVSRFQKLAGLTNEE
jgi:hypothetical protein